MVIDELKERLVEYLRALQGSVLKAARRTGAAAQTVTVRAIQLVKVITEFLATHRLALGYCLALVGADNISAMLLDPDPLAFGVVMTLVHIITVRKGVLYVCGKRMRDYRVSWSSFAHLARHTGAAATGSALNIMGLKLLDKAVNVPAVSAILSHVPGGVSIGYAAGQSVLRDAIQKLQSKMISSTQNQGASREQSAAAHRRDVRTMLQMGMTYQEIHAQLHTRFTTLRYATKVLRHQPTQVLKRLAWMTLTIAGLLMTDMADVSMTNAVDKLRVVVGLDLVDKEMMNTTRAMYLGKLQSLLAGMVWRSLPFSGALMALGKDKVTGVVARMTLPLLRARRRFRNYMRAQAQTSDAAHRVYHSTASYLLGASCDALEVAVPFVWQIAMHVGLNCVAVGLTQHTVLFGFRVLRAKKGLSFEGAYRRFFPRWSKTDEPEPGGGPEASPARGEGGPEAFAAEDGGSDEGGVGSTATAAGESGSKGEQADEHPDDIPPTDRMMRDIAQQAHPEEDWVIDDKQKLKLPSGEYATLHAAQNAEDPIEKIRLLAKEPAYRPVLARHVLPLLQGNSLETTPSIEDTALEIEWNELESTLQFREAEYAMGACLAMFAHRGASKQDLLHFAAKGRAWVEDRAKMLQNVNVRGSAERVDPAKVWMLPNLHGEVRVGGDWDSLHEQFLSELRSQARAVPKSEPLLRSVESELHARAAHAVEEAKHDWVQTAQVEEMVAVARAAGLTADELAAALEGLPEELAARTHAAWTKVLPSELSGERGQSVRPVAAQSDTLSFYERVLPTGALENLHTASQRAEVGEEAWGKAAAFAAYAQELAEEHSTILEEARAHVLQSTTLTASEKLAHLHALRLPHGQLLQDVSMEQIRQVVDTWSSLFDRYPPARAAFEDALERQSVWRTTVQQLLTDRPDLQPSLETLHLNHVERIVQSTRTEVVQLLRTLTGVHDFAPGTREYMRAMYEVLGATVQAELDEGDATTVETTAPAFEPPGMYALDTALKSALLGRLSSATKSFTSTDVGAEVANWVTGSRLGRSYAEEQFALAMNSAMRGGSAASQPVAKWIQQATAAAVVETYKFTWRTVRSQVDKEMASASKRVEARAGGQVIEREKSMSRKVWDELWEEASQFMGGSSLTNVVTTGLMRGQQEGVLKAIHRADAWEQGNALDSDSNTAMVSKVSPTLMALSMIYGVVQDAGSMTPALYRLVSDVGSGRDMALTPPPPAPTDSEALRGAKVFLRTLTLDTLQESESAQAQRWREELGSVSRGASEGHDDAQEVLATLQFVEHTYRIQKAEARGEETHALVTERDAFARHMTFRRASLSTKDYMYYAYRLATSATVRSTAGVLLTGAPMVERVGRVKSAVGAAASSTRRAAEYVWNGEFL